MIDLEHCTRTKFAGTPKCATKQQYDAWAKLASGAYRPSIRIGFCEDCTPEFQAKNIRAGTCENPGVLFDEDADGMVYGTLPNQTEANADAAMQRRLAKLLDKEVIGNSTNVKGVFFCCRN